MLLKLDQLSQLVYFLPFFVSPIEVILVIVHTLFVWREKSSAFHLSVQVSLVLGITDIKFKTQENVDNNWRISLDNNLRWNRFIPVKAFRLEWCIKTYYSYFLDEGRYELRPLKDNKTIILP